MTRLRWAAFIGVFVATLCSSPYHSALAQESGLIDDSTYRFGLDGTEIRWEGNWEYDPASSGQFEGYEIASFISPEAGLFIGEIASIVPIDLDALLAVVLDTLAEDTDQFVTVERSATDVVSYSLDAAIVEGIATALFTYVQFNAQAGVITYTSVFSDYDTFADNIADAQDNVTVNGRVALEGIDGAVLQSLLPPLEGGSTGDDEENDTNVNGGQTAPDDESDEPEDDEAETPDDDRGGNEVDADLAALGIVEEGLYESPQFGTEVEWSNDWDVNEDFLSSDEDEEVDNLGLAIDDGAAVLLITVFEAGDATPADYAAFWESDEFLEENASPEAEVLLSDSSGDESGVLIADPLEDGGELWALRQAYSLDGGDTIVTVLMVGLSDDFPDYLADAQDGVEIDGDPALSLFSVEDVEDAA